MKSAFIHTDVRTKCQYHKKCNYLCHQIEILFCAFLEKLHNFKQELSNAIFVIKETL